VAQILKISKSTIRLLVALCNDKINKYVLITGPGLMGIPGPEGRVSYHTASNSLPTLHVLYFVNLQTLVGASLSHKMKTFLLHFKAIFLAGLKEVQMGSPMGKPMAATLKCGDDPFQTCFKSHFFKTQK
jgi:hypothetical protein